MDYTSFDNSELFLYYHSLARHQSSLSHAWFQKPTKWASGSLCRQASASANHFALASLVAMFLITLFLRAIALKKEETYIL